MRRGADEAYSDLTRDPPLTAKYLKFVAFGRTGMTCIKPL
jgi:hypothetical protein